MLNIINNANNDKSTTSSKIETDNIRMCKICLESDPINSLISPCQCKGSIKYVHPHCMARWRKALLRTGRENDIYHCQLCKQRLWVKQRRLWAAILHYKIFRIMITALLLGLILIPAGSIMKTFTHFSAFLSNYPGGLTQAWASNSLFSLLFSSIQSSILASFSSKNINYVTTHNVDTTNTFRVLYSPFPVCFSSVNSNNSHSLFSNRLFYYFLFPFSDERLWQLILCQLEHFHLGFFLLGSVNNIYFTYKILNDMFDIVLLGQEQQLNEDRALIVDEILRHHLQQFDENNNDHHHQQPQPNDIVYNNNNNDNSNNSRLDTITIRLSKLLKGFLLTYCCSLVVLFWIHFNIFAFHVDSKYEYTSKQFLAELPLWILRWATLGIAVADFATRGIYRWLSRITNCVDEEVVLSLPENIK